jgi:hypothetical protein
MSQCFLGKFGNTWGGVNKKKKRIKGAHHFNGELGMTQIKRSFRPPEVVDLFFFLMYFLISFEITASTFYYNILKVKNKKFHFPLLPVPFPISFSKLFLSNQT